MKHLSKTDFVDMPWKNGGGTTREIYRVPSADQASFLFRISMADVKTDGPFSIFPYIDRTLFLVSGDGMILKNSEKENRLIEKWKPFHFSGEDKIDCQLINGPCQDFNIMVDRRYGKVESAAITAAEHTFNCTSNFLFIYDTRSETLSVLEKDDTFQYSSTTEKLLVVVNLNLLHRD